MARGRDSFWHSLGRSVENVISPRPGSSTLSSAGRSRPRKRPVDRLDARDRPGDPVSGVLVGAVTALIVSVIRRWSRSNRPSPRAMAKGAVAGAGAAGAALIYRLLLTRAGEGSLDPSRASRRGSPSELADELLAGAGRGLIYAALLDPYLGGPPIVRGAIAGTVDYLVAPLGGLFSSLQEFSPIRRVPVISVLLEAGDAEDDPYLTFLLHGAVMGLLYGDDSPRD